MKGTEWKACDAGDSHLTMNEYNPMSEKITDCQTPDLA